MKKNILVLTGSPRKGGNSDMMADAFIRGATAQGHTVTKFETAMKSISGCRACDTCWSTETACSFHDGFTELEPLLEQADVVVLATPLYWFSLPAQLKAAIDRLYAYGSKACRRPLKATETALLACGEGRARDFDGAVETYKGIADYLRWQIRGIITVPAVSAKGDIVRTDALTRAEKLGAEI